MSITGEFFNLVLFNLKPTTLAAMYVDLREQGLDRLANQVCKMGVDLIGENDFELMIARAGVYVG